MAMGRRDFEDLARELAAVRPREGLLDSLDWKVTKAEFVKWEQCCEAVARVCEFGNFRFNKVAFLARTRGE